MAVLANPDEPQAFDLNVERVLEHWPVAFAIREVVANALDEAALTSTAAPDFYCDTDGDDIAMID